MRHVIAFVLSFICFSYRGYGQFLYFLDTPGEVKAKLEQKDITYETHYDSHGDPQIVAYHTIGAQSFVFKEVNGKEIMIGSLLAPWNALARHAFIETLNKYYVRKGDTEWRTYLNNGLVVNVKMIFDEDAKEYVFLFYIADRVPSLQRINKL